jgi:hypothetical protein
VWGEKDGWLDPSLAPRLRKEIPGSELKLIQEGGHFVQEDAPEEIAKALAGFFSGDGERARGHPCRGRWTGTFPHLLVHAERLPTSGGVGGLLGRSPAA